MRHFYNYDTIIDNITIVIEDDKLIKILFGKISDGIEKETELIKEVKKTNR